MKRYLIIFFTLCSYGLFQCSGLAFILFLLNLGPWKLIDGAVDTMGVHDQSITPWMVNLLLVLLFALPHSAMARTSFKTWLKTRIPASLERSIYVFLSSSILIFLMWAWQPIPTVLWRLTDPAAILLVNCCFGLGWLLMILATFQINHWELFGISQAIADWNRRLVDKESAFVTPLLYRLVRHPMMTGTLLFLWASPDMSLGHAYLAFLLSIYILIGTRFEEKDLIDDFGQLYRQYKARVPALIPGLYLVLRLKRFRNRKPCQSTRSAT